jgi:hypothetical protein
MLRLPSMRPTHPIDRRPTMTPTTRRPMSAVALSVLAVILALVVAMPAAAQDAPSAPPTPVPGLTLDPGIQGEPGTEGEFGQVGESPEPPFGDGATPVEPEKGLLDIGDVPWDHLNVAPDGRTLTVYFWSGAEACYGLAGVTVDATGDIPVITLQVGTRPGVDVCIAIAQLYSTQVVLDEPIVGGGAQ